MGPNPYRDLPPDGGVFVTVAYGNALDRRRLGSGGRPTAGGRTRVRGDIACAWPMSRQLSSLGSGATLHGGRGSIRDLSVCSG